MSKIWSAILPRHKKKAFDPEYIKCPVCDGNPRRWLSYRECMSNCIHPGSYEDCTYCDDGYVQVKAQQANSPDDLPCRGSGEAWEFCQDCPEDVCPYL